MGYRLKRYLSEMLISFRLALERQINARWFDYPFGRKPKANKEEYLRLAEECRKKYYPQIDAYEKQTGYSIDSVWLHDLGLHTQVVIKDSDLCYAHGRVLYCALSTYLEQHPAVSSSDRIAIWETGTARGFSALCMAKALHDQKRAGLIVTFDVLPHQTPMYWNCIDDLDGPKTRADLLQPWKSLVQNYILFFQDNTRIALPKMVTDRINFAFLDGAHTYQDIMFEFDQIHERQQPGDIIVYDDYTPQQFPGLVKAVDLICKKYRYQRKDLQAHSDRGFVVAIKQ